MCRCSFLPVLALLVKSSLKVDPVPKINGGAVFLSLDIALL